MIFATIILTYVLSVASTGSSLSLPKSYRGSNAPRLAVPHRSNSGTSLYLKHRKPYVGSEEEENIWGEEGAKRKESELEKLVSKRKAIIKETLANTKPNDNSPEARSMQDMTDEEIKQMLAEKGDDFYNDMFSREYIPQWKTDALFLKKGGQGKSLLNTDDKTDEDEEEKKNRAVFIDWLPDYDDENDFHIPNRIGFSTMDWGDEKKGFVDGKLKKKDRKAGKFNKVDLRKAYEILQQNGISFVETSESFGTVTPAEEILREFIEEVETGPGDHRPLVASTYPNPWKQALKSRSLPRYGAKSLLSAAEESAKRLGILTMDVYQVQNPGLYIGGSSAIAAGLLDVCGEDHATFVGTADMSIRKVAKLQKKLNEQEEYIATHQFEFSLTNRKGLKTIEACKKMGIIPVCKNVLDSGLATGRYTSTQPTGGEVPKNERDTGPFPLRKLEKLEVLFQTQDKLRKKISDRIGNKTLMQFAAENMPKINRDITTTQIAINYVRAKGAVPIVPVNNPKMANELIGCLGWDLTESEVEELEKACQDCGI